jgi:hypothetical protein
MAIYYLRKCKLVNQGCYLGKSGPEPGRYFGMNRSGESLYAAYPDQASPQEHVYTRARSRTEAQAKLSEEIKRLSQWSDVRPFEKWSRA